MSGTQYLQVPKVLPHRKKSQSRSRSRPREVKPQEVVVTAAKDLGVQSLSKPPRLHTPPCPPANLNHTRKPSAPRKVPATNGSTATMSNGRPLTNGHIAPAGPVAALQSSAGDALSLASNRDSGNFESIGAPIPQHHNVVDLNGGSLALEEGDDAIFPEDFVPLRQRIVGAWKLESYIAYPTAESAIQRPTYPMTKNVSGFIMYTPDGYMSAQMLIPGQQSFKRGEGEEAQWAEAGKRFFGYCGPYYISDEGSGREEVLRHTFQVCNLPGWIGDVQIRTHSLEEDGEVLVLGSEEPTEIKGDKRIPVLKWRRAMDNSMGSPPPPMPQIKISGPGEPLTSSYF
ncbi:hypothetical protein K431DRAFT_287647 [Polychaeton citri CBS 116435]|uniref:Lipocalin-like domain-containing protein n=1 Tax=Polychaeton citri CBS 116435 TaxID=1314669 RepID=A0A9P4Q2W5_9PEZI|nr:hypothetical protein K431DRAFT_287647 [Polychaeton citri CBS 116435]